MLRTRCAALLKQWTACEPLFQDGILCRGACLHLQHCYSLPACSQVRELRLSSEPATKALAQLATEFSRVDTVELDGGEKVEVEVLAALQKLPDLRHLTIQVCAASTHAQCACKLLLTD